MQPTEIILWLRVLTQMGMTLEQIANLKEEEIKDLEEISKRTRNRILENATN